jgi:hypothetical protein
MPASEEMLTIAPRPCPTMIGSAHLHVKNMPFTLTFMTRSHDSSDASTGPPAAVMPTLLWSTSSRRKALTTASVAARTASRLVTFALMAIASPPSPLMMSTVACAAASFMSTQATFAPARA